MNEGPVIIEPAIAQRDRLKRFSATRCVDIHCHCLPGLDDGPTTLDEALILCGTLVDDGITDVVATPHQLGRYDGQNWAFSIRQAVAQFQLELIAAQIPLVIHQGADVRIDERLVDMIRSDQVMTLADTGRYVLLELPHEATIDPTQLLRDLSELGCVGILSHPERNSVLNRDPNSVRPWLECGALLQVTGGSLLGQFGTTAERAAWHWLEHGLVQLIATDSHDAVHRGPSSTEAISRVGARLPHVVTRRLFIENPQAVLLGEEIAVKPNVRPTSGVTRRPEVWKR